MQRNKPVFVVCMNIKHEVRPWPDIIKAFESLKDARAYAEKNKNMAARVIMATWYEEEKEPVRAQARGD